MSGDETIQNRDEDYESEEDGDDELELVPHVDVDVTKLNPLSPEVISKQVCIPDVLLNFSRQEHWTYLLTLRQR